MHWKACTKLSAQSIVNGSTACCNGMCVGKTSVDITINDGNMQVKTAIDGLCCSNMWSMIYLWSFISFVPDVRLRWFRTYRMRTRSSSTLRIKDFSNLTSIMIKSRLEVHIATQVSSILLFLVSTLTTSHKYHLHHLQFFPISIKLNMKHQLGTHDEPMTLVEV